MLRQNGAQFSGIVLVCRVRLRPYMNQRVFNGFLVNYSCIPTVRVEHKYIHENYDDEEDGE